MSDREERVHEQRHTTDGTNAQKDAMDSVLALTEEYLGRAFPSNDELERDYNLRLRAHAANLAATWTLDYQIINQHLQDLVGLSRMEALLYHLLTQVRDVAKWAERQYQWENMRIEQQHKDEQWRESLDD